MKITSPEQLKEVMKYHGFSYVQWQRIRSIAIMFKSKSINIRTNK